MNEEKNYYQEIIEEIKKIRETDLDQAVLLLKKELAMPYIPSDYQAEMQKLFKEYSQDFDDKKITLTREEVLDIITSEGQKSGKLSLALTQISQFNWVGFENEIQKIISSPKIAKNAKTIFIESLIIQKMNHDFIVDGITINPSKLKSVFDSKYCIENIMGIESKNIDDLVVKRIAMESFLIYLSIIFPENLKLKYVNVVDEMLLVAKALLGDEKVLEGNEEAIKIFETISKN
ncbi:MAG: hypothetical protein ACRC9F_02775 [Metamycoplasmataceae bacterium]